MESVDKWMGKRGLSKKLRMRIGQHYQEVCVPALEFALHRAADRECALAAWPLHSEIPRFYLNYLPDKAPAMNLGCHVVAPQKV
jgi:hypothetical protein